MNENFASSILKKWLMPGILVFFCFIDILFISISFPTRVKAMVSPNSIYTISPQCATNKVIDISGGSIDDCAKVQLFDPNSTNAQKFIMQYAGNSYYIIRNVGSNKVLDVCGGNSQSGIKVQQYTYNGTDAQLWRLMPTGDGSYYISTKLDGNKYLDVEGAGTSNGTNIQIYTSNNTNAQKWKFTETPSIANGTYCISPKCAQAYSIDIAGGNMADGANVQIFSTNGTNAQKFILNNLGNNYYTMTCVNSNKLIDVAGGNGSSGTNVWQYTANNTDAQKWILKYSSDENYFYIITRLNSNMYLDVAGGSASNGTNVQIYTANFSDAQKWRFTPGASIKASESKSSDNALSSQSSLELSIGNRLADFNSAAYNASNPLKNYKGQCTWYAWGRALEKTGIRLNTVNNAKTWLDKLNTTGAKVVRDSYQPRANSIAVRTSGTYGHVMFVEDIIGDTVYYTEANVPTDDKIDNNDGILKSSSKANFAKKCNGYIYLN